MGQGQRTDCMPLHPQPETGWVIRDGGRLHIPRVFETEAAAEHERAVLLIGFPADSEWRTRLVVVRWWGRSEP